MKREITEFGKKIKIALIERNLTQNWLIDEVKNKTGLFFDSSYLNRIMIGERKSEKVITAIKDILAIQ